MVGATGLEVEYKTDFKNTDPNIYDKNNIVLYLYRIAQSFIISLILFSIKADHHQFILHTYL